MISIDVIIITHGREDLLWKCLASLRIPTPHWELILVANGKELSPELLSFAKEMAPKISILQFEQTETPGHARNRAMAAAKNDWIFFIDDDAYLMPGYFDSAWPAFLLPHVDILGGPDSPAEGMSAFSEALATALSSPLCTGKTFVRHMSYGKSMIQADEKMLTSCNLWVRRSKIGKTSYPEDYRRGEETIFLQELSRKGAGVYYHPKMTVGHFRRKNLRQLLPTTFLTGYFRSRSIRAQISRDENIYWLPSLFLLLHFVSLLDLTLFGSLGLIYLSVVSFMSLTLTARRKKIRLFPLVAFLHYFIVMIYGLGFLAERFQSFVFLKNIIQRSKT